MVGRKTIITKKLIHKVKYLKEVEKLPVTQIAKEIEISRSTVYKILKNELGYVPTQLIKTQN